MDDNIKVCVKCGEEYRWPESCNRCADDASREGLGPLLRKPVMNEEVLRHELDEMHEMISMLVKLATKQSASIDAIGIAVQKVGGPVSQEEGDLDSSIN